MQICGIICEYNPLHLGHQKQLDLVRSQIGPDGAIVCLMSGNFVQRGHPAVFDKMVRAKAAVECGADLVLELPITYALSSAEGFAAGGVKILSGLCHSLCFGAENADATVLTGTARALLSPAFSDALRQQLDKGLSFPAARQAALGSMDLDGTILETPNNILAVEYCKALLARGSAIQPLAIPRGGDYHGDDDPAAPSATTVREKLLRGEDVSALIPPEALRCFAGQPLHDLRYGERAMLALLRAMTDDEWARVPYGSEGLWSKVMKNARREATLEGVIASSLSRRYPRTRLQRLLLLACLGIDEQTLSASPPYVRALAFDDAGRALLKKSRADGRVRVINAGDAAPDEAYGALERRASDLYGLFSAGAPAGGELAALRVYYKGN